MPWTTIDIAGKPADLFHPASSEPSPYAILHLHGHSEVTLKDNPAFTESLQNYHIRCICPHGRRSWWLDRICPEYDPDVTPQSYLLQSVIPWIQENWQVAPPAIGLTGISMGGQGVLQFAYRHARQFPVVAALAPTVDFQNWYGRGLPLDDMFDSPEAARQATAILNLHPLNWPRHQFLACDPTDEEWFDSADKMSMKLYSSGIPHDFDFQTSNGGHSWEYFETMADKLIGWTAEKLDDVSRSA